ncbi:MAG: hypothetical protein KBI43_09520 [Kiritimatiellae bacterium]|nr:hypothetical protein [Kiritimatiellia bacterium]
MALINFDCPECGHNLEVDERGAGFIIKCPECANPLQIPELPKARRIRKITMAAITLVALVVLCLNNIYLWQRGNRLRQEVANLQPLQVALQQAQEISMQQETEISRLQGQLKSIKVPDMTAWHEAAQAAVNEAELLARELEDTSRRLLDSSADERTALLRRYMAKEIAAAKDGLPAQPIIKDVNPGQGINGRQIIFPILPGPEGQVLRENAEIIAIDGDKVSVKHSGGVHTYSLSELHRGVAAFLPIDPLLVLPRNQRNATILHVHQTQNAIRDQKIKQLRETVDELLADAEP